MVPNHLLLIYCDDEKMVQKNKNSETVFDKERRKNMNYPKVCTIQDISCVGQCSLTVALPILSACGVETCILPSAVLSTHTGGFKDFTFCDLTEEMPKINAHWQKEQIAFDAIYTGYLGSTKQIQYVMKIIQTVKKENAPVIIDPAMADNGKLYVGFDETFVEEMKKLCAGADYLLPNLTEACFLTNTPYQSEYDQAYIDELLNRLCALGAKNIILTGVSYCADRLGVVVYENHEYAYYEHEKLPNSCHGTGDIYASAFCGALLKGKNAFEAASIAANYVMECIRFTATLDHHWYGAAFEPVLSQLIEAVNK